MIDAHQRCRVAARSPFWFLVEGFRRWCRAGAPGALRFAASGTTGEHAQRVIGEAEETVAGGQAGVHEKNSLLARSLHSPTSC
jgi:hypothetical protein